MVAAGLPLPRRGELKRFAQGRVVRRQVWIAALMGLIAVMAIRSLWSSSEMRPRTSGSGRPPPAVQSLATPTM